MASVYPGVWMFVNSVLPEALNTGPANSLSFARLRASGVGLPLFRHADEVRAPFPVLGEDEAAVR